MARRLGALLCLVAIVSFIAQPAFAAVQNVKVSGDLNVYGFMRELNPNNNNQGTSSDRLDKDEAIASIIRLRVDADLSDNVSATARLINERYWGEESVNGSGADGASEINLDLAHATFKEFLYSPLTLIVGRQELRYGNAMIIGDVDTNNAVSAASGFGGSGDNADLSLRKAFDAVRAIFDYNPLVVDVIYAKTSEGTSRLDEDDTDLYGVNANYTLNDKTILEGYWFERHIDRHSVSGRNKVDRIDTLGARVATQLRDNLKYQLESAYQLGTAVVSASNTAKRRAFAVETALTYDIPNLKYSPSLTGIYAYFSGQKGDDNKTVRAWNPMYEDQTWGRIANAQFNQSNLHAASLVGVAKLAEDLKLQAEYWAFWWDKRFGEGQSITTVRGNTVIMTNKKFAAQEIDLTATYDYTEDVRFSLLSGIVIPGRAFDKRNRNTLTELIGKMTVTF